MLLCRYSTPDQSAAHVGFLSEDGAVWASSLPDLSTLLTMPLHQFRPIVEQASAGRPVAAARLLPPVDGLTEVWASGVTYLRSQQARMEESQVADVYSRVYDAERPELFFKSIAWRCVGPADPVGIRADSTLNVPEPELALIVNRYAEIVGVTICDDVSSRNIEGENPLYLPQAKIYAGACSLGPGIRPIWEVPNIHNLRIEVTVERDGVALWNDATSTSTMRRTFSDIVEFLFRADTFPHGVVLSTGTGLVPEMDISLAAGDRVSITIDSIGTLSHTVVVGKEPFAWLTEGAEAGSPVSGIL